MADAIWETLGFIDYDKETFAAHSHDGALNRYNSLRDELSGCFWGKQWCFIYCPFMVLNDGCYLLSRVVSAIYLDFVIIYCVIL